MMIGARTTERMWRPMMLRVAETGDPRRVDVELAAHRHHRREHEPIERRSEDDAEDDHR